MTTTPPKGTEDDSDKASAPARANSPYDEAGNAESKPYSDRASLNESEKDADSKSGLFNADGDEGGKSSKSQSPGGIKKSEEAGNLGDNSGGLYNDDDEDGGKGRFGRLRGGYNKARGVNDSARGKVGNLMKKKWFVGGFVGASTAIGLVVILVLLVAGSYKIVNFAEHVAAYQFARTTRMMSQSTDKIVAEKMGLQMITDSNVYVQAKNTYGNATGKVKNVWSKFDKFRPNKIIETYRSTDRLKFNYETTRRLGIDLQKLTSVTIDGKEVPITRLEIKNSLIPGYKFIGDVQFARDFAPALNSSLKSNNYGPVTRAKIALKIRKELNISLRAWAIAKYAGKTQKEGRVAVQNEVRTASNGGTSARIVTGPNAKANDVARVVQGVVDEGVKDENKIINPAVIADEVDTAVVNELTADGLSNAVSSFDNAIRTVLNAVNPVYAVATPACLIYEGSMVKAGPSIEENSARLQRSGLWVQSAAAQQKDGKDVTAEAVEATNWKLGDVSSSNAGVRAGGQRADTSKYASAQSSATGQYSTSLGDLVGEDFGNFMDSTASTFCPLFTNIWVGVGLGVANLAAVIGSGGTVAGGEAAAQAATQTGIRAVTSKIKSKLVPTGKFAADLTKSTVKTGAVIAGATLVAQQIVMQQTGQNYDSLSIGDDFTNDVDNGNNLYAQQINQQQFYGAPLADEELSSDNTANQRHLSSIEADKSGFDRYLAVTNPNSLVSRAAISVDGFFSRNVFNSLLQVIGNLLSPLQSLGSTLTPLISGTSFAADPVTSVNTYYGNVQFGYTAEENSIIRRDLSYRPFKNQEILDTSGLEDEINSIYAPCFDGSKKISELLTTKGKNQEGNDEYWIQRNDAGNIIGGICSQKNVGPHNEKYGNLVFRWRLAANYRNVLDQLIDQQEIRSDNVPAGTDDDDDSSASIPQDVQELAKQLLQQANAGKIQLNVLNSNDRQDGSTPEANLRQIANGEKAKTTTNCAGRSGTAAGNRTTEIDPLLLAFILDMSQQDDIQINALAGQCHSATSNHYKGKAVDFGCPFSASKANEVGRKYGVSTKTGETCAADDHYHYSIGGN